MSRKGRTRSKATDPLRHVRLTESERLAAQHAMEQGEQIADFIVGAAAAMAALSRSIARVFRTSSHTKSMN